MSDLPEINFKKKREKRGFLPWLRSKLGLSPAGGTPGGAGIASQASNAAKLGNFANIGKSAAFGSAKIGASTGFLGGVLAGKGALVATAAIFLGAVGTGLYMSSQNPTTDKTQSAFNSDKTASAEYIPSGLRQKKQGSSLDMFRSSNDGVFGEEEAKSNALKDGEAKSAEASEGEAPADEKAQETPNPANMAAGMLAKMSGGGLSNTMGGGSNKFSGMGGFGNKFGTGQVGPKVGFNSDIGAGFQALPKFKSKQSKMLAAGKRSLRSKSAAGKKGIYGRGAHNQAKGIKATQASYAGGSIDGMRSTQDAAWEGTTGEGTATGGEGIGEGEGGSGIVTSPSLDEGGSAGGGGSDGEYTESTYDDPGVTDVSPWASLASQAMMYILLSAILSAIGGALVAAGRASVPIGAVLIAIGMALCGIALLLGLMALMNGLQIMTSHGQALLGSVYTLGGGVAIAAAIMGMTGSVIGAITPLWMAAIAGVIGLIGGMMSSPGG